MMKPPYAMMPHELQGYQFRSSSPNRSAYPGELPLDPASWERLYKGPGDELRLRRLLGETTQFPAPEQFQNARQGRPVRIWRATNAEDTIFPGAWVTTHPDVADRYLKSVPGGKLLKGYAAPSDLYTKTTEYPHPHDFLYAPDVPRWHRGVTAQAVQAGHPVPAPLQHALFGRTLDPEGAVGGEPKLHDLIQQWGEETRRGTPISPYEASLRQQRLYQLLPEIKPALFERLVHVSGIDPRDRQGLLRAAQQHQTQQVRQEYGDLLDRVDPL